MSIEAIRVFSPTEGFLKEEIKALDIKSREDARSLGPFLNSQHQLVLWVNWGKRETGKRIRPYFRRYVDTNSAMRHVGKRIQGEYQEIEKVKHSDLHKRVQEVLLTVLRRMIREGKNVNWAFKNTRLTDFPLTGDLLSEVRVAEKEHRIFPPFISHYDLDIALLGDTLRKQRIVLGAIEIEHTHEVDLLKTLLCKALGFPLVTIDISDMTADEITEEWCFKRLTETTFDSGDERRRNYIYIHNLLYPIFLADYDDWGIGDKHQYIIFATDRGLMLVSRYINLLKDSLSLTDAESKVIFVNRNFADTGSNTMFENEGALTGETWQGYNSKRFIRLILKRPKAKYGKIYLFHLVLTQLLTLNIDCLVGYKPDVGKSNFDRTNPIWYVERSERNSAAFPMYIWHKKRFCPKRISEPIKEILKYIPTAS